MLLSKGGHNPELRTSPADSVVQVQKNSVWTIQSKKNTVEYRVFSRQATKGPEIDN